MRTKLKEENKKKKLTTSINPILFNKLFEIYPNVSKQIEWLVYQDMKNNNLINEMPL